MNAQYEQECAVYFAVNANVAVGVIEISEAPRDAC